MGKMLDVSCKHCGTVTEQIDGALMSGFNPRCVECGATRFVSLADICATDPPSLEPSSNEAWQLRYDRIPDLAGMCDCGGRFAEDAPIRCLQCRSQDVETMVTAMVD
jgi:hypothetical protein